MKILSAFVALVLILMSCLLLVVVSTATASSSDIRGVMYSLKEKYISSVDTSKNTFTCLDGKKTIKLDRVNDEYCDCADGSDEPGTAACTFPAGSSNANTIPSEFRFQCSNAGYEKLNQQFFHSRINDGFCDCCDGSDEYLTPGKCSNRCAAYSAERAEEEKRREENRQAGLAAKSELLEKATKLREEWKQEVITLESQIDSLKKELEDAEADVAVHEATEKVKREEIHQESLKKKAEWEVEQEEKKRKQQENEKQTEAETPAASDQQQEQEQAEAVKEEQHLADKELEMKTDTEAGAAAAEGLNDDGVKIECVYWRQTGGCSGSGERERAGDRTCDQVIEGGHSGFCECKADDNEETYPFDCGHKPLKCEKVCAHRGAHEEAFEDITPPAAEPPKPAEPETFTVDDGSSFYLEEATQARRKRDDARNKVTSTEESIKTRKADLEKEYGTDNVFLGLANDCFEKNAGEFVYKLCPMKETWQSHTSLGKFKSFATQTYGSWGGKEDFTKQIYEGGTHCWGGPARSCEVVLICGPRNEIKSVEEPSMCAYKMVFQTPAICE